MSLLISSEGLESTLEAVAVNISVAKSSTSRSAMAARMLAVVRSFSVVVGEWKFSVSERMAPSMSPASSTGMGIWFSRKMVATMVQVIIRIMKSAARVEPRMESERRRTGKRFSLTVGSSSSGL